MKTHGVNNTAKGVINTLVGRGVAGYGGDHGPGIDALLNYPFGINLDEKIFICKKTYSFRKN